LRDRACAIKLRVRLRVTLFVHRGFAATSDHVHARARPDFPDERPVNGKLRKLKGKNLTNP
jgi:hypothetical protein